MGACKRYRSLLVEELFNEIGEKDRGHLNSHLQKCQGCTEELAQMQRTLGATKQKARSAPESEFWEMYFSRLQARMAREKKVPAAGIAKSRPRFHWAPALKLAGAAAILLVGILIGRFLIMPQYTRTPDDSAIKLVGRTPSETQEIDYRTARYLERSKILLLGLLNADPIELKDNGIDLSLHRKISQALVKEAAFLKSNLTTSRQRRLTQLIEELEVILLEIANMEEQEDIPGIDMLKSSVKRKGILMKINIQEMATSMSESRSATISGERVDHTIS